MKENAIELIYKIKTIEREQNKRKGYDRLVNYNKGELVHIKQLEFHKCLKRNRWVFGGNRTGKTECGAVEAIWFARGIHPYRENKPNVTGWVVSVSYEVQRDVAQSKILMYLSPDWISDIVMTSGRKGSADTGIIDTIIIKNVFGGLSKISFKSADQGREKFQGASLDFVWFDEEPPSDIYEECRMRVLDKKGDLWGTMTPLKGLTWVYDEVFINEHQNPEIWCIQMEWTDNPFLDADEVKLLIESTSADLQESRRFGRFKASGGLVYPEFDANIHVIEPFSVPFDWQCNMSIDPGLNNPLSCHFYAVDGDGTIYVIGEHYEGGKDIDYHAEKIHLLATQLNWHRDNKGRLSSLIDSAANQHTLATSKSVAELFIERDILVNTNVNKDLFSGIARIKSLFCTKPPKIYIFSCCVNLIRELRGYWWSDGDRPKKRDDHSLDELRYFVMSMPLPNKALTAKLQTEIERDRDRLGRQLARQNKFRG
ncbi:MAG: terminase family protein [Clostridia bacterium]